MDNQKPYIKEGQTIQWPKEKRQNDKQRSTKYLSKEYNIHIFKHNITE
jgi:hypothetical protein